MVKYIIILIYAILASACVGTIESKKPLSSETVKSSSPDVVYSGITAAIAIAHDKVDVFFKEGSLPPEKSKYIIYTNDSAVGMEVNGNRLTPTLVRPGEYKVTIDKLNANTSYTFSVTLMDTETGVVSNVNKKERVSTFANKTADFNGILSADPLEGVLGKTEVRLKWIPATILGDFITIKPEDPILYRVQYINADDGTASDLVYETKPNAIKSFVIKSTNGFLTESGTALKNFSFSGVGGNLNETESTVVTGLTSGKKYYFLVRVAHEDFSKFGTSEGYKYEENLNVKVVTTMSPSVAFSWDELKVTSEVVPSDTGLKKRRLNWAAAKGPFDHYRVYIKDLANMPDSTNQPNIESITNSLNNNTLPMPEDEDGFIVSPSKPYTVLDNLKAYHYYNVKVAACYDVNCSNDANRIISPVHSFRLVPVVAPFFGVKKINDPVSSSTLGTISLSFDPPVTSLGYITHLEVYCMGSAGVTPNNNNVTLLAPNVNSAGNVARCTGLKRTTPYRDNITSFNNFNKIEIVATDINKFLKPGEVVSSEEFCFAIIPVIKNGTSDFFRDEKSMVIKCKNIQKKMPTVSDFPGAKKNCTATVDNKLKATWSKPSAGIYNGYTVYWKKNTGSPFLFTDAMVNGVELLPGQMVTGNQYYKKIISGTNTVEEFISGLAPGNRFQYGVLAHEGPASGPYTSYTYSDINVGIQDCAIELPNAKFNGWVDILAIGPKEHGMSNYRINGVKSTFLPEILNDYGQPVELELDNSGYLTDLAREYYGDVDAGNFDGIYGKINEDEATSPNQKFSTTGIIKIAWKDVQVGDDVNKKLNDLILSNDKNIDGVAITKPNRRYGYHVYRSEDNQATWIKLTGLHNNQRPGNVGLLHPKNFYEWDRSNEGFKTQNVDMDQDLFNEPEDKFNAVTFTDYSVSASLRSAIHTADRARVYYYKVVPVVNGNELEVDKNPNTGITQNIIKVVLPPPNMAYVSRLMANRQTCLEIGKTPSNDVGTFYTCPYNGVGAKSLTKPTIAYSDDLVYDIGKDFLIDRYELGCNITRGEQKLEGTKLTDWKLEEFTSAPFQGCAFVQGDTQISQGYNRTADEDRFEITPGLGQHATTPDVPLDSLGNKYFRRGDCVGQSYKSLSRNTSGENYYYTYSYPGFYGDRVLKTTSSFEDFTNPYKKDGIMKFAAQSEFAAVYENYSHGTSNNNTIINHQAKDGTVDLGTPRIARDISSTSSCTINLSTVTNDGTLKPRWISANTLSHLKYEKTTPTPTPTRSSTKFSIVHKTIDWLTKSAEDNYLYDDEETQHPHPGNKNSLLPGRFNKDTKIGRIISSNAAKLPPLTGLNYESAGELCSTYEVEVGYVNNNNWIQLKAPKSKRTMRRTEGIIANAWPRMFVEGSARRAAPIEGVKGPIIAEVERPIIDGRTEQASKKLPLVDIVRLEQGLKQKSVLTLLERESQKSLINPAYDFNAACLSSPRRSVAVANSNSIMPGEIIYPNYKHVGNNSRSILASGSSIFDSTKTKLDLSTQDCISRYGLQDVIGNALELSSEQIHCDGVSARDNASIKLVNIGDFANPSAPRIEANPVVGERVHFNTTTIKPRGEVNDSEYFDSIGKCAVDSDRSGESELNYKVRVFSDGIGSFKELFDIWGRFTTLVAQKFRNLYDPGFIENLRTGTGSFLDFGKNGTIGVELLDGDELKLYDLPPGRTPSKFFSPVIGIPLLCPEDVCGGDSFESDHYKVTTKTLLTEAAGDTTLFPIGNSQIESSGVLAIDTHARYTVGANPSVDPGIEVSVVSTINPDNTGVSTLVYPGVVSGDSYTIAYAAWRSNLNYPYVFYNFGSATRDGAGRYGAVVESLDASDSASIMAGTRCAISLD